MSRIARIEQRVYQGSGILIPKNYGELNGAANREIQLTCKPHPLTCDACTLWADFVGVNEEDASVRLRSGRPEPACGEHVEVVEWPESAEPDVMGKWHDQWVWFCRVHVASFEGTARKRGRETPRFRLRLKRGYTPYPERTSG